MTIAAPGVGLPQQRVEGADQPPGGVDVHRHRLLEDLRLDVADRCEDAEQAGIGDEDVELAPALVDRAAEPVDAAHVGEVERHEGRRAARRLDLVVEFLEAADRAGDRDDVRALGGEPLGDVVADAARGAGDQRDPVLQPVRHVLPATSVRLAAGLAGAAEERKLPDVVASPPDRSARSDSRR